MQLGLRMREGDWGYSPEDTAALARSVIGAFSAGVDKDRRFNILLERHGAPMAVSSWLSERGEHIVHIGCPARHICQFTYQLAHEFTHVMAESLTFTVDRFAWFEESLAETGSLFALSSLSQTWATEPPRPYWQAYHREFEVYTDQHLAKREHRLPHGKDFSRWLIEALPSLEANHVMREQNTIIAHHILSVFESDPTAWRALRHLHEFERPAGMTFPGFLQAWRARCPQDCENAVDSLAERLGVSYPPAQRRPRRQLATALQYVAAVRSAVAKSRPASRATSAPTTPLPKSKRPGSSTE